MDLQLKARVILVVGGHGLVGSAVVKRLRAEGAIAIPASRSANEGIVMDATSDESVNAGVARVLAEHGRIDGLVMTAATVPTITDPKLNSEPSRVLDGIDTKAMTFIRITNAVLPHMTAAGYGRVVGVSGQNAAYTANMTGSLRNAALNGSPRGTCATSPSPKNVSTRCLVRSISWSGTTRLRGELR